MVPPLAKSTPRSGTKPPIETADLAGDTDTDMQEYTYDRWDNISGDHADDLADVLPILREPGTRVTRDLMPDEATAASDTQLREYRILCALDTLWRQNQQVAAEAATRIERLEDAYASSLEDKTEVVVALRKQLEQTTIEHDAAINAERELHAREMVKTQRTHEAALRAFDSPQSDIVHASYAPSSSDNLPIPHSRSTTDARIISGSNSYLIASSDAQIPTPGPVLGATMSTSQSSFGSMNQSNSFAGAQRTLLGHNPGIILPQSSVLGQNTGTIFSPPILSSMCQLNTAVVNIPVLQARWTDKDKRSVWDTTGYPGHVNECAFNDERERSVWAWAQWQLDLRAGDIETQAQRRRRGADFTAIGEAPATGQMVMKWYRGMWDQYLTQEARRKALLLDPLPSAQDTTSTLAGISFPSRPSPAAQKNDSSLSYLKYR